jgi:phage shock protein A
MTDQTSPRVLQSIQADLAELKELAHTTHRSIGNLAQSILQLRTDSNTVMLAVNENSARMASLENRVTRMLSDIDTRIADLDTRLSVIEQQLRAGH